MKTTLLMTVLLIIGFSSVANAQNWVLWQYVISEKPRGEGWEILEAFPSYEFCMKEWDKKVSLSALSVNAQQIRKGEFLVQHKDGSTSWTGYKCLPETIDPRKGH